MSAEQKTIARILDENDLRLGVAQLVRLFPEFAPVVSELDTIPLRRRAPGFEGLAQIITAQQVSKASATAIFERTLAAIQPFTPENFLAAGEEPLIAAGQSRAKQETLTRVASAIHEGALDLDHLCVVSVDDAMERMTSLKGIGPWTAEVFLLFCAGHADVFPAGDVALQHALKDMLDLPAKPDTRVSRDRAAQWAPLRGVAARVFYAHYARIKGRSAL